MPWSLESYETFVYRIQELSPHIVSSTLVVKRRSQLAAILSGEVRFAQDLVLSVYENLDFYEPEQTFIVNYGYEVLSKDAIEYRYDSQPHPNDPTLQSTHPHHKHIHPDLKHHRIPAPELSFSKPNLPFLISEIENLYFSHIQDLMSDA